MGTCHDTRGDHLSATIGSSRSAEGGVGIWVLALHVRPRIYLKYYGLLGKSSGKDGWKVPGVTPDISLTNGSWACEGMLYVTPDPECRQVA